jgi:hypothetical protein
MSDPPLHGSGGGETEFTISAPPLATSLADASPAVKTIHGAAWPSPDIQGVPPQPIKIHQVTDERLQMLADLPRRKWNEYTWAALGGMAASLPSAVEAIVSSYKRTPFSMEWFEVVQLIIFVSFFVWFLSQRIGVEKTSGELLNEIRNSG